MTIYDRTFAGVKANAEHFRAIGETTIHLGSTTDAPWEAVIRVEPWGTHRLDITTGVRFMAELEGLTYTWSFDIETRDANGASEYRIDAMRVSETLARLSGGPREQFLDYLRDCADRVSTRADEFLKLAQRQYGDAAILSRLASSS